jgi:TatA/E family protein of Tat protein translocase
MGNLGMPELMMIMFLALLLFGSKKLPEIGKQVGKALGEFKHASHDLKCSIEDEMEKANIGGDLRRTTDQKPALPDLAPVLAEGAVSEEKSASGKPVDATKASSPTPFRPE